MVLLPPQEDHIMKYSFILSDVPICSLIFLKK